MDNGYYNQGMGQPNPAPQINPQSAPEFTKYLVLSIIQLLCCNQITGIVALVFTILANSAFKIGNILDYQSKIKGAKTTLLIGWIVGILLYVFIFVIYVGAFGLVMLSEM